VPPRSNALLLFLATAIPISHAQTTAPNEWTWMGGSQTGTYLKYPNGLPGVYGTLGTPAVGNIPGGRDGAATWMDNKGNLWLFGGEGADANGYFGQLNDLWEFNRTTQQWTWMGGSSTLPASCASYAANPCGQPGTYGTLGTPARANVPGGRSYGSHWTDGEGNFWLFGGFGFDADQNLSDLNDLWEFNPSVGEWTWKGGSNAVGSNGGQPGVYGTEGSPAISNILGGRYSATNWVDNEGQFWLYGGLGFDSQGNPGSLDDMWKFDPATSEWTWVSGSNSDLPAVCAASPFSGACGWPAVYGTIGVPAPGISPGSRIGAAGWTDSGGSLWLFGGLGTVYDSEYEFGAIDQYDLWKFNPSTQQWAWMSGNSTSTCSGVSSQSDWCAEMGIYGTEGVPSIANIPPSRDNAVAWADTSGNFWLFGGEQPLITAGQGDACNDVWVFEPAANEWAWMNGASQFGGSSCPNTPATFGVLGMAAAANTPSSRMGAASWSDSSGNLWIFGGFGWSNIGQYELNELWTYQPSAPVPQPSFKVVASPNPINVVTSGAEASTVPTATTTVSLLVAGGFDSPVTLTADNGTVDGVTAATASFSPTSITGGGSSALTISITAAGVQMGQPIPLTITAAGGGVSQSTLVIVEPTATGKIAAPTFSVPAGTYSTPQTVAISGDGGYICYTTDGTTPTVSSPVYVNPITIASKTTLKAIVIYVPGGGGNQSAVSSATYDINPHASRTAAPTFSVPAGTYGSTQSVVLGDATTGADIYYTTDGTTPTTSSTVYSGPITVSSSETIQAVAAAGGYTTSSVASATYTIHLPPAGFSLSSSNSTLSVSSGGQGVLTLTVTPQNGFNAAVTFACTSQLSGISCSFNPASVTPDGTNAAKTKLTVAASASASNVLTGNRPWLPGATLALAGGLLFWKKRRAACWTGALLLSSGLFLISACGGGASNPPPPPPPTTGTVTVTATSGSLVQTANFALTINH